MWVVVEVGINLNTDEPETKTDVDVNLSLYKDELMAHRNANVRRKQRPNNKVDVKFIKVQ